MVFRLGPARPMKVMLSPLCLLSHWSNYYFDYGAIRSIDLLCFFHAPPGVRSGSSMSANPIADKKAVHYLAVTNGGP